MNGFLAAAMSGTVNLSWRVVKEENPGTEAKVFPSTALVCRGLDNGSPPPALLALAAALMRHDLEMQMAAAKCERCDGESLETRQFPD